MVEAGNTEFSSIVKTGFKKSLKREIIVFGHMHSALSTFEYGERVLRLKI